MALYLIDGNSLAYKAFYAIGELCTQEGVPTGAVYGFTNMLLKILEQEPQYIAAVFDSGAPTFRHKEYKEYKEKRPPTPSSLSMQLPFIKEIVEGFGIKILEVAGFEADDVIATVVEKLKEKVSIIIISPDKDMLQLVQEGVKVLATKKGLTDTMLFDSIKIKERFGIHPYQIPDFLALVGDASDNVPGVPGIGEKIAKKLLQRFGNVESLINNLSSIENVKLKEALEKYKEQIIFYRNILRLRKDVPLKIDLSQFLKKEEKGERLLSIFSALEFRTLLPHIKTKAEFINLSSSSIKSFLNTKDPISFYIKGDKIAVCTNAHGAFTNAKDIYLKKLIEDDGRERVVFDLKEFAKFFDIKNTKGFFDVKIAAHLLSSAPVQSIDEIYIKYMGKKPPIVNPSICAEAFWSLELFQILKKKIIDEELQDSFFLVELPLSLILAEMERRGIRIDEKALFALNEELLKRLEFIKEQIYKEAGIEFNINSPKQLSHILFEHLALPKKKRTKTGYCTAEEVLLELAPLHPLPAKIIEYREVQKIRSSYVEALMRTISEDGRVHTSISQTNTSTGRLSISSPPLQTIPQRGEFAKALRSLFVPTSGYRFLSCDYSQMELRVFAHLSGDEALCKAFRDGKDFHEECALRLFGSKEKRDRAKIVNFGILYGITPFGLSKELKITPEEAEEIINEYFRHFPKAAEYIREVLEFVHKNGYVKTLYGRKRYIPHINSANPSLREFAKRAAINSVIQGTAAEIMKEAMLAVHSLLKDEGYILLQIHDELIFEIKEEVFSSLSLKIRECMEKIVDFSVPFIVNTKSGHNFWELS